MEKVIALHRYTIMLSCTQGTTHKQAAQDGFSSEHRQDAAVSQKSLGDFLLLQLSSHSLLLGVLSVHLILLTKLRTF